MSDRWPTRRHSRPSITLDVYSHEFASDLTERRRAASALNPWWSPMSLSCLMSLDLSEMPTADLFALYRATSIVLKERGVIRTMNAPAGDYAEYLVGRAFVGSWPPTRQRAGTYWRPTGTAYRSSAACVNRSRAEGNDNSEYFAPSILTRW